MARGITAEDVWQAADDLVMDGQRPTIERVRQKIGRGSPNTVSPHLDAWFERLGGRLQAAAANPDHTRAALPSFDHADPAPEPWLLAAQQLWSEALELARVQAKTRVDAEMAETRQALAEQSAALVSQQLTLDAAEADLQARAEGFRQALSLSEQQLHELRQDRERMLAQIDRLQHERNQLDEALQSLQTQSAQERALQQTRSIEQERYWQLEVERSRERARILSQDADSVRLELSQVRAEHQERVRTDQREIHQLQLALSGAQALIAAQQKRESRQERDPIQRLKRRRDALKGL